MRLFTTVLMMLLLATGFGESLAQPTAGATYSEAFQAQQEGDLLEAAGLWESHLAAEPSALGWYHLALTYSAQDKKAEAVYALLQSERYGQAPGRERLATQLYAHLPNAIRPLSPRFFEVMSGRAALWLSPNLWAGLGLLFWLLAWVLVIWKRSVRHEKSAAIEASNELASTASAKTKKGLTPLTRVLLISLFAAISLLIFAMIWTQMQRFRQTWAVVTADELTMYSAPGTGSETLKTLPLAAPVKVEEQLSGFYRINLPDGSMGWVEAEGMRLLGD